MHGLQRLADIAERGHVRPQIELLEHHADLRAHRADAGRRQADRIALRVLGAKPSGFAIDEYQAGRRFLEKSHAAQKRALAGTGRTDEAGDLPLRDVEVDSVQHFGLPETLDQSFYGNGWRGHAVANLYLERRVSMKRPSLPENSTSPQ